jgi:enamine deaminase RidA (YjgF/YER057c/UK114 family)
MSHIRQRCADLGLVLPAVAPRGLYHSTVRHGGMLYLSGQVSRVGNGVIAGPVDALSSSERSASGRAAALRALAALADALAPGERLRVLKLTVFVMSNPQFQDHSAVADGASQLLIDVLGEGAVHSRTAVGVASLPSSGAVELDMICAVSASE